MSEQSQSIADVFRFAREARQLAGETRLVAFERLRDQLARSDGALVWRLTGRLDAEGKALLALEVTGRVVLRCQRCLAALDWPLAVDVALSPLRVGQPVPEGELDNDEVDVIEVGAEGGLDVLALIEDEIILALPFVPRHEEDCAVLDQREVAGGAGRESPFAVLSALAGGQGRGG
jgi:uncharacterized protein